MSVNHTSSSQLPGIMACLLATRSNRSTGRSIRRYARSRGQGKAISIAARPALPARHMFPSTVGTLTVMPAPDRRKIAPMTLPNELTATEAYRQLADGTMSAEALTQACLERISTREPEVHAWEFLDPNQALA